MKYDKGTRGENELGDIFQENGYVWARQAGSGTADRELPDILVGNTVNQYALEVKRWDNDVDYKYLSKQEVHDLIYFSYVFGCEYYIAVRFDYGDWGFFKKEDLIETEKQYRVDEFKYPDDNHSLEEIL